MKRKNTTWDKSIKIVLSEADEPMHYTEIAERIGELGLKEPGDNTPYTVSSYITNSIKNDGDKSPYVRTERGKYALKDRFLSVSPDVAKSTEEPPGLINAFGLHWARDKVDWRKSRPQILGYSPNSPKVVDFCTQKGVYVLHDTVRPVYVGQSGDEIGMRLKMHTTGRMQSRWSHFSWFELLAVDESGNLKEVEADKSINALALLLEAVLIEVVEPPLNRQQGKGFKEIECTQEESPELEDKNLREQVDKKYGIKLPSSIPNPAE